MTFDSELERHLHDAYMALDSAQSELSNERHQNLMLIAQDCVDRVRTHTIEAVSRTDQ